MKTNNILNATWIPALFILLVIGLLLIVLLSLNKRLDYKEQSKVMQAYIPVLVDDHEVLLIRGSDTISLKLENAHELQDEFVVYVTQ